jgi:hypothetical protein
MTQKKGAHFKRKYPPYSFLKHVRFWRGQTPPYKRASKYTKIKNKKDKSFEKKTKT